MRNLVVVAITLLIAAVSIPCFADSRLDGARQPLLAQGGKKKKKKAKKSEVQVQYETFGPDDIEAITTDGDSGAGVHREQEGVDTPYKAEINVRADLSNLSVDTGEADPYDNTIIDFGAEWLVIFGSFEVGLDIAYKSFTSSTSTTAVDPSTQKSTTTVTEISNSAALAGGLFKWNFGNIDKQNLVPFAYGGVAYQLSSSETEGAKALKRSGSVIKVGGGMNLFLDSNVAFNPRVEFRMESEKDDAAENAITTTTTGFKILVGIAVFI
jgi:hypothetical protein